MSLAAVPIYFLARRVLPQRLSLVAAVLSLAIPSMVYTGTLMTENAFYPVFLSLRSRSCSCSNGRRGVTSSALLTLCALAYVRASRRLRSSPRC